MGEALINGDHRFGFLHIKAVDDTGHDRNLQMKVHRRPPSFCLSRYKGCREAIHMPLIKHVWRLQHREEVTPL